MYFPGLTGQHQFRLPEKGMRKVAPLGVCYSLLLYTVVGTEDRSMPSLAGVRPRNMLRMLA
jgi:hypothetical protein